MCRGYKDVEVDSKRGVPHAPGTSDGLELTLRSSFPINVNIEKNKETDNFEVEIRNFIGEKIVRRVQMRTGVNVEASANQKDELLLSGNVRITSEAVHGTANKIVVSRGCLPECRRYPADLQSP